MKMTGAEAIIESLNKEKVDVVFGYPGGAVLTLYDALYQANFNHILTKHEQGAVHAADGYARATGKVGVVIATSGPGATNLVTGIATAYMDSIPLVAITGQVSVPLIGRDSFQEADIRGITTPITKHNYLVKKVEDLPGVLKEAFYIARTGRPGPVVVDVAKDVFAASFEYEYPQEVKLRGYRPVFAGDLETITKVLEELRFAKQPLIFIGGGVNLSDSSEELINMIEQTGFPVISSLMGLGCIPFDHPQFLGMVGMHGTYAANMATTECDVLLGIGVRFDDRVTGLLDEFAAKAKIIHFDIDPAEINKNVLAHLRVVGDMKWSIPALSQRIKLVSDELKEHVHAWMEKCCLWQDDKPLSYEQGDLVMPQAVVEKISQLTQGDAVIVTDVGQHQMWVAQYYGFKNPRSLLTSGGLGTMGYGLPAALGAQCGLPDRPVILFIGDGGMMMNCQELAVAAEYNFPVKVMVFNNQCLGMVAQWQRMFYGGRYSHTSLKRSTTDFVKLAEAMGVKGLRIDKPDELDRVMKEALAISGPVVVDIRIPEVLDVLPMVPSGARLDQMIIGGKEG